MKKLITLLFFIAITISCNKENCHNKRCPIVISDDVPTMAISDLYSKYDAPINIVWFKSDVNQYCVVFDFNSQEHKMYFDNNGNYLSEEIENDTNFQGQHEDNDSGCECDRDNDNEHKD